MCIMIPMYTTSPSLHSTVKSFIFVVGFIFLETIGFKIISFTVLMPNYRCQDIKAEARYVGFSY